MTPLPALMTTGEAATHLGVSVGTIRRWAKTGRIPHVIMPSGRLRFRAEDLTGSLRQVEGAAGAA